MSEIRTVTTLRHKRDEIVASIKLYERQLAQAHADLAHVQAAIRIFEASGSTKDMPRYMDVHRLFKRGETWAICREALAAMGAMTTKELALAIMKAKKLETGDKVFARTLGQKLIHSLRMQQQRGRLVMVGKRVGVSVWRLATDDAANSPQNRRTDLFSAKEPQAGPTGRR